MAEGHRVKGMIWRRASAAVAAALALILLLAFSGTALARSSPSAAADVPTDYRGLEATPIPA